MNKIIGAIGGLSSLYSVGVTLAFCLGTVYFFYNKYVTVPVDYANERFTLCNTTQLNNAKIYDANLSSVNALLAKCRGDITVTKQNAYDEGYVKGVKDAETIKVNPKDDDVICFKPEF